MRSYRDLADIAYPATAVFLRVALGITFLASVTDRFGVWGPPGTPDVAWGNLERFASYATTLNPWAPRALIPAIVWIVTVAESCFGVALIIGFWTRWTALGSGILLLLFALGMTVGPGVKAALNASVFSASAAAFALATWRVSVWSFDAFRERK